MCSLNSTGKAPFIMNPIQPYSNAYARAVCINPLERARIGPLRSALKGVSRVRGIKGRGLLETPFRIDSESPYFLNDYGYLQGGGCDNSVMG